MKANELLFWLSARREGSWPQFRAAVEELHASDNNSDSNEINTVGEDEFPLHQQLRLNLDCLAHVEFFARDSKFVWRVAPPTLAAHPIVDGFRMVLCGARSPALRERVLGAGHALGCETCDARGVPKVIRFAAKDITALSAAATQAGIGFQPDAPLAILSHLPPCDPPSRKGLQCEFPEGADWRIREFDAVALLWRTTDRRHAQTARTGLYEFQLYDRWEYFLRKAGRTFKLPRAVGIYAFLRSDRDLLRYDGHNRVLSLPGSCRPPRLLERALVLCSGFPATFDPATSRLTYADVPPDIARFAAELLRQRLA